MYNSYCIVRQGCGAPSATSSARRTTSSTIHNKTLYIYVYILNMYTFVYVCYSLKCIYIYIYIHRFVKYDTHSVLYSCMLYLQNMVHNIYVWVSVYNIILVYLNTDTTATFSNLFCPQDDLWLKLY